MGLTKRQIDAAIYEGDGKSADYRMDGDLAGFGMRVYPGGTKSFVLRYRTPTGRERFLTLGRYGVLTLTQARDRARRALSGVWDGRDPAEVRQEARKVESVADFLDLYLERHAKPHRKTWKEDERRIETHLKPCIGHLALADVTPGSIAALHAEIGKDAKVEANRVVELFRAAFNKALKWGNLPRGTPNPASDFDKYAERSRDRWVRPSEMKKLAKAIGTEPNPYIRAAVWLLLLTGCRKGEILGARWADVDFERGELRIPETKSGPAHVVPLTSPALRILEQMPRERSPFLFPGRNGTHMRNFKKAWARIREDAGIVDVTIHDLRRSVGSWMANSGTPLQVIGAVLNHQDASTTEIYARLTEDAPRKALESYADELMQTVGVTPNVQVEP